MVSVSGPSDAVTVIGYEPPVPGPGVPERSPAGDNDTPEGRVPVSEKVVGEELLATIWKVPALPTVKVAVSALVIVGVVSA